MKKFLVTQHFAAPLETVQQAYRDETTWQAFGGLPFVGDPIVDSFVAGDPTVVSTRYRVKVDLPAMATTFIDADKLTFVEVTTLLGDGSGTFEIVPDHYGDLLESSGRIELVSVGSDASERRVHGHVTVDLGWAGKLFEGPVEDVIVKGLTEALLAQAQQVRLN